MKASPVRSRAAAAGVLLLIFCPVAGGALFFPGWPGSRKAPRLLRGTDAGYGPAGIAAEPGSASAGLLPLSSPPATEAAFVGRARGPWMPGSGVEETAGKISLSESLGLSGGIGDLDYYLDLLRPGAGREEIALAARLLGVNQDLASFPEALVDRLLVEPDGERLRAGGLLLDLSLRVLDLSSCRTPGGSPALRFVVEAILEAYEDLYARLGEALGGVTRMISSSGCIASEDLEDLLGLAQRVPGTAGLVRAAVSDLVEIDPFWAERLLFDRADDFTVGMSLEAELILQSAALDQLLPLDALDLIASGTTFMTERPGSPGAGPDSFRWRREALQGIARRLREEELFHWLRVRGDGDTSRLLVSVLSPRRQQSLLTRLAHSAAIEGRLRGGAVVKLAGVRANEDAASMVLGLLQETWPGRSDLFIQASENLLSRSGSADAWTERIVLGLRGLLDEPRDKLSSAAEADLLRLLSLYGGSD